MDSRFLESFVMVIDNGSFAETARRLAVTTTSCRAESSLDGAAVAVEAVAVVVATEGPP